VNAADLAVVGLRALSFVAVLQAAGVPLFLWLYGDEFTRARRPIAAFGLWAAVAALLLTLAQQAVAPARLTGALAGTLDWSLQALVLASDAGAATGIRVLGLAMVAVGVLKSTRAGAATGVIGATLVATSFALAGHTATHDQRWLLVMLLAAHLLVVVFWFGALLPFYFASTRDALNANAVVIERFSIAAVWLVPLILVAGLAMAWVLLPGLASFATPYGALLLAKIAGFAALMALAAANKWRWGPMIAAGRTDALPAFRRSVLAEWALIAGVVSVTAVMTGLFSPGH
jgi:putative copper export protein